MKKFLMAAAVFVLGMPGARAQEKVFDGWKESIIWVSRPQSKMQVSAKGMPFGFELDFAMQGAVALAERNLLLSTEPKGLRIQLDGPEAILKPRMEEEELIFFMGSNPKGKVASLKIEEGGPRRILVRQLDQAGLYVISEDRKNVLLVWCGLLDYRIRLRAADVYELCENIEVAVGEKKFGAADLMKGLALDHLDELQDVVVKGLDPQKKPFVHRYSFDLKKTEGFLGKAFDTVYAPPKKKEKADDGKIKTEGDDE